MNDPSSNAGMIRSELAGDPDMQFLIQMFVDEIPARIDALQAAWEKESSDEIMRLAHQLKGAAPGYGFGQIGQLAGHLEAALKSADQNLNSVRAQFDSLVQSCGRVAC